MGTGTRAGSFGAVGTAAAVTAARRCDVRRVNDLLGHGPGERALGQRIGQRLRGETAGGDAGTGLL